MWASGGTSRHFYSDGWRGKSLSMLMASVLLISGVALISPESAEAQEMTTLRIGMLEIIDSLNPFLGILDNAYVFYGLVYDYLVAVDEDLEPKPNLATSWYVVPDIEPYGSVWQYNLTRNAQWHDGEPFNAEDVKFTFDYQIGDNWWVMWAYQPYTLLVKEVEIVDEFTVRMHFADMDGFPAACSFGHSLSMPIVPEHIWRDITPSEAGFSYENPFPIGTGPFMCTENTEDEWIRGDRVILYTNPNYHGAVEYGDEVKFDRLILEFYLEAAAMVTDMQRGAIDVAMFDAPNYKNLVDWIDRYDIDYVGTDALIRCTGFSVEIGICQNPESGPGTNMLRLDPAVRKAMAHATDKDFINEEIYKGYSEKGSGLLSPIFPYWYWEPPAELEYYYSLDKANEILDEAGYLWDDDHRYRYAPYGHPHNPYLDDTTLSFNCIVEEGIYEDKLEAKFLVEEWADIGIHLDPVYVDSAMWGKIVYEGTYDTMLTYWSGDADPNYLLYVQSTWALDGWSENWYSSEEYDENYTNSLLIVDPEERLPYVHNCQMHTYVDAYFIVTGYPYGCFAWREDTFTGWGDWEAHPGRQLANFWTANDLFFDLEAIEQVEAEPMALLDNIGGHVGNEVEVTAFAWDPEGRDMTYSIEFGDGEDTTGTVADDGEIALAHTYDSNGTYMLNLTVQMGTAEELVASNTAVIVEVGENAPPSNLRVIAEPLTSLPGEPVTIKMQGKDADGDTLDLFLDFDDGSDIYETSVSSTSDGFVTEVTHTYDELGSWDISLLANDSLSESEATFSLIVAEEADGGGGGISSLMIALLVVVVIAVVVVAIMFGKRRGRKKEDEEDIRLP